MPLNIGGMEAQVMDTGRIERLGGQAFFLVLSREWESKDLGNIHKDLTLRESQGDRFLLEIWCAAALGDLVHQLPDAHAGDGGLLRGLSWRG